MYRANLSYDGLKRYLEILLGSSLLKSELNKDSTRTYVTTKKGLEFLDHTHAIRDLLGDNA
jgi:predicted transcriptional regulator